MSEPLSFIPDEGNGESWSVRTFVGVIIRIRDGRTGQVVEALVTTERARQLALAIESQAAEADRQCAR